MGFVGEESIRSRQLKSISDASSDSVKPSTIESVRADDMIECDMIGFTADASAHILARGLNGAIAVTACDP